MLKGEKILFDASLVAASNKPEYYQVTTAATMCPMCTIMCAIRITMPLTMRLSSPYAQRRLASKSTRTTVQLVWTNGILRGGGKLLSRALDRFFYHRRHAYPLQ